MKSPESRDQDLGALFQAQRSAERSQAPDIEAVLHRRSPSRESAARRWWRIATRADALVLASVATLVLVVVVFVGPSPPNEEALPPFGPIWESPTDYLLDMPGLELISQMPVFGTVPEWLAVSAPSSTSTLERSPQ